MMLKTIKCFVYSLKYLFQFNAPAIDKLEFVDFVFKRKGYFLISWNISKSYILSIPEASSYYFTKQGSVAIKIPDHIDEIKVTARNTWRKYSKTIKLTRIELNTKTDFNLINHFEALKIKHIQNEKIIFIPIQANANIIIPRIKKIGIEIKSDSLIYQ